MAMIHVHTNKHVADEQTGIIVLLILKIVTLCDTCKRFLDKKINRCGCIIGFKKGVVLVQWMVANISRCALFFSLQYSRYYWCSILRAEF